ncbi:ras association domain-containing protein 10 [Thalassophryne amazonica]|uniref:ras association domain-containing protein 10 n=1 Tax=Thalassophryne amazonica TaxID=390379 RepID=UPI001470A96C|nr:ras association domain-containing protein 10 [Thalassophryne amazonica]
MVDLEQTRISVWVCRDEKLLLGLSKRTTCADVVKALLEDQNCARGLTAPTECALSYCIVEKWRGFERILPNATRMLQLWAAWADEQKNVKFVLVKSDASLESHGPRSAVARVLPSKHSPCVLRGDSQPALQGIISAETRRRIVRKAFRKLEKMNKSRARAARKDASSAEKRMETLVHLVISQDHTIRQQMERIKELDSEIERREAEVHLDRVSRLGVNYVQDAYLEGDRFCAHLALPAFEEYVWQCEEVTKLQKELREQEALIEDLSAQIQEDQDLHWMKEAESELVLEGERIRTQLEASWYVSMRLGSDLETIRNLFKATQETFRAREEEVRDLQEKVNSLELKEKTGEGGTGVNDDDSDTGLSSLHSQDSDSQA